MNIAVVDDQNTERQYLLQCIRNYYGSPDIAVDISEFTSGESLLRTFSTGKYDVIFLDIYMQGISGMETAKHIRRQDTSTLLIFTTVSTDFAVESYRVQASDYLIKPYSNALIHEVLRKCDRHLQNHKESIQVKEGRSNINVPIQEIQYVDYYNHYVQIHTLCRIVRCHMKFEQMEDILSPYIQFIECGRNCIVNMDEVTNLEGKTFILRNQERIPISRSQYATVHTRYAEYAFDRLAKR